MVLFLQLMYVTFLPLLPAYAFVLSVVAVFAVLLRLILGVFNPFFSPAAPPGSQWPLCYVPESVLSRLFPQPAAPAEEPTPEWFT